MWVLGTEPGSSGRVLYITESLSQTLSIYVPLRKLISFVYKHNTQLTYIIGTGKTYFTNAMA